MKNKTALYMVYSADKYELPMCIGTIEEVCRYLDCSQATGRCKASRGGIDRKHNCRVIRIGEEVSS